MIVRNERENLGACLESVRSIVDEMIVVDTGSTDGTSEIVRSFGARLLVHPWNDDFSAARNVGLAAARGTWILVLDADEILPASEGARLRALLSEHNTVLTPPLPAFRLVITSSSDGGLTGARAHIVRLFPNRPDVRYESPIHEQIVPSLHRAAIPVLDAEIEIIHSGYADPTLYAAKQRRNRRLLEAQVDAGRDVSALTFFLLGGARLDLDGFEAAAQAYREAGRLAGTGSELASGAIVRLATCLVRLRRFSEALELISANPGAGTHPELLVLRAQCELAGRQTNEARLTLERVLDCKNATFFPPCNLFAVKAEALVALGNWWKDRGQIMLAVELLRGALACRKTGVDFTTETLVSLYQRHRIATNPV